MIGVRGESEREREGARERLEENEKRFQVQIESSLIIYGGLISMQLQGFDPDNQAAILDVASNQQL